MLFMVLQFDRKMHWNRNISINHVKILIINRMIRFQNLTNPPAAFTNFVQQNMFVLNMKTLYFILTKVHYIIA